MVERFVYTEDVGSSSLSLPTKIVVITCIRRCMAGAKEQHMTRRSILTVLVLLVATGLALRAGRQFMGMRVQNAH